MPESAPRWITEAVLPYGREGVRIEIAVTAVLYDERTAYGHVQVVDTPFFGRTLLIDGIVQTTASDEFVYHELMVTLPALVHGAVRRVLVVGGGDGGALRQACRLPDLERAVQVEIDDAVTEACRRHLPEISGGAFDDPRVRLVYADGAAYVRESAERFDLVVLDLTDPMPGGPAASLFGDAFLRSVRNLLTPQGIVMAQCGSLTFQPDEVTAQLRRFTAVFGEGGHRLHHAVVPSYQLTSFGFLMGSVAPLPVLSAAEFDARAASLTGDNRFLTAATYHASFALPPYLAARLGTA